MAALLAGALLTIGFAVLCGVVFVIRKRRDPVSRSICDDKDKHLGKINLNKLHLCVMLIAIFCVCGNFIGMDMTVTAPIDMGTGQQRYVVAYTLKQGIDKQPDILNAQKSESLTNSSDLSFAKNCEFNHFIFFFKTDSDSTQSFKDSQSLMTPPAMRPDALYLSKSNYNSQPPYVGHAPI